MAKAISTLDWCVVRLGEDHNWWVAETSDPVRWDVDGLSLVDPRQLQHLIELVDPLRDYGFDQDVFEAAFIPFRIEKEAGAGKVRLKRVKESLIDSDEKLFALADVLDDENGPYADLLDHLTRCRVKMLNDIFKFESKLSVDEVEDEIREDQNSHFIQGKAVHTFEEVTAVLDYMPAGYDSDEEAPAKAIEDEDDADYKAGLRADDERRVARAAAADSATDDTLKLTAARKRVLAALQDGPAMPAAELAQLAGVGTSVVKTMAAAALGGSACRHRRVCPAPVAERAAWTSGHGRPRAG